MTLRDEHRYEPRYAPRLTVDGPYRSPPGWVGRLVAWVARQWAKLFGVQ
jgi:hypothetical protein